MSWFDEYAYEFSRSDDEMAEIDESEREDNPIRPVVDGDDFSEL